MKSIALIALLALSSQAFAATNILCSKNQGTDSAISVEMGADGSLHVYPYEASIDIAPALVKIHKAVDVNGKLDTQLYVAQDVSLIKSVEGEEEKVVVTAIFAYNPPTQAGRLTLIENGRTIARNQLFTDCK